MTTVNDSFKARQTFDVGNGRHGTFYSLPALQKAGFANIARLPVSLRIVLESVLRNCDGKRVSEASVRSLAQWQPTAKRTEEIPFVVSRIVLQDFTGVPLLVDLAAMRSAAGRLGKNPKIIEPLVPVDLVVDHSVQVDFYGTADSYQKNLEVEFKRNRERYQFLKWGTQAFDGFSVVPPGIGIVHQVNLEHLAKGVLEKQGVHFFDTLVGTDSHTTMINGLGVVGWGVGGIEAEAGMLGQPVYFLTPDVVGVHMTGSLREGVTATDVALTVTQMLRKAKVVGKFVEFYGEGAANLTVSDRATIANMAPEYGATIGFFPFDDESCQYLIATGRSEQLVNVVRNYFKAQGLYGMPKAGQIDYSHVVELNLAEVEPSIAGPKRPQDRIPLPGLKERFLELFQKPIADGGYNKTLAELNMRFETEVAGAALPRPATGGGAQAHETLPSATKGLNQSDKNTSAWTELEMANNRPTPDVIHESPKPTIPARTTLGNGDIVIAAITSCTNTSNPSVMLGAGLLAKKAVERGLKVRPTVKTSLAPGSRVVMDYFQKSGLKRYLDQLGFNLVGYGCTTCIGNSGPLDPRFEEVVQGKDLVVAAVLSGNRNFEARVHQNVKANFLMSPPLVVAFALAGRVDVDLTREPLGKDKDGRDVFLREIWPTMEEVRQALRTSTTPETYRKLYSNFGEQNPLWNEIPSSTGLLYSWVPNSTYIQEPPFFEEFSLKPSAITEIRGARLLALFGDSVTTDHISPAGSIKPTSPSGVYLLEKGVTVQDFNSYGARRGNDRVMTRGTFANIRIKNLMIPGTEGGITKHLPDGKIIPIYDAAVQYQKEGVPLMVIAGQEYGTGSSRDWAAKGTRLLGVRAVLAQSFERIHRSNLVGMGVLPLQFKEGVTAQALTLDGTETYDVLGLGAGLKPQQDVTVHIIRADGRKQDIAVVCRIDTPIEVDYYQHGGILPYVLRQLAG